jgi:hypothetical protein
MQETIDLIGRRELRNLRAYTRETDQPTSLERMDLQPMEHVNNIEIDEEHITIKYNEAVDRRYNTNAHTYREWSYKYNDDPEMVAAIAKVVALSRKHLYDMPENASCPPGCAECCKTYEPFVSGADVERIAQHLGLTYAQVMREYVNERPSADGFVVGWLKKKGSPMSACSSKAVARANTTAASTRAAHTTVAISRQSDAKMSTPRSSARVNTSSVHRSCRQSVVRRANGAAKTPAASRTGNRARARVLQGIHPSPACRGFYVRSYRGPCRCPRSR